MAPTHLETVRDLYDERAPIYDEDLEGTGNFHKAQQADYIKWMSLSPGLKLLDLACGTGGITIPAARTVGPTGTVIGVDISPKSLDIARSKAQREGLSVTFLEHDIGNLVGLETHGIKEGTFDLITCAAAFVMVENPGAAVKNWATLLKKGGKLIFDASTNDSLVPALCFDKVKEELNIPMVYGSSRTHIGGAANVRRMLTDAGLDDGETFLTESYLTPKEFDAAEAGEIFESVLANEGWARRWYKDLGEPSIKEKAKGIFIREFTKMAGEDGKVKSYMRFHMGIGKKV